MAQDLQVLSLLKKLGHNAGYEIPEEEDLSGTGANLEIHTPEEQASEQEDAVFQSQAGSKGYIPIGYCMVSTGDMYCIHLKDPTKRGLYRFVRATGEIVPVLENISTISRYRGK